MAEREGFDYRRYPQLPNETYTSMIIACVGAGYKRIATSVPVSIVSLIGRVSRQNGITGISSVLC